MQNLRNRSRQRRLPMINMTNRPNVQVRLRALELLFRHLDDLYLSIRNMKMLLLTVDTGRVRVTRRVPER
jgi:hypothetical protein